MRLLGGLVFLPTALSAAPTGIKRLHDRSMSGCWLLPLYAVPAAAIGIAACSPEPSIIWIDLPIPLLIWAFIALGCRRGTAGPNAFGPETIIAHRKKA